MEITQFIMSIRQGAVHTKFPYYYTIEIWLEPWKNDIEKWYVVVNLNDDTPFREASLKRNSESNPLYNSSNHSKKSQTEVDGQFS